MNGIIVPDGNSVLQLISPTYNALGDNQHLGTIAVIGGILGVTGAACFAAISAVKLGAGCLYVICTDVAAPVIQNYCLELLVMPILYESNSVRDEDKVSVSKNLVEGAFKWVIQCDCLVIGPGLGSDQFLQYCVSEIMKRVRQAGISMVVEGDGYDLIRNDINLIRDYPLAVLRITIKVFKLFPQTVVQNDEDAGFALSGSIAVFIAWARLRAAKGPLAMSQTLLGCIAASTVFRRAGAFAFENKKRSTLATDIIENLAVWRNSVLSRHNKNFFIESMMYR